MPRVPTLTILKILKLRQIAFAQRPDRLRGQKGRNVGCNPNVLMGSWLDKAIECAERLEEEMSLFENKTGISLNHEHGDSRDATGYVSSLSEGQQ